MQLEQENSLAIKLNIDCATDSIKSIDVFFFPPHISALEDRAFLMISLREKWLEIAVNECYVMLTMVQILIGIPIESMLSGKSDFFLDTSNSNLIVRSPVWKESHYKHFYSQIKLLGRIYGWKVKKIEMKTRGPITSLVETAEA